MRTVASRLTLTMLLVLTYFVISQVFRDAPLPWSSSPSAHDFRLPLVQHDAADGEAERRWISLDDLAGSPVLLNFWASWCEVCRGERPHLTTLSEKYQGKGLQMVGIATLDTEKAVLRNGIDDCFYPIAVDREGLILQSYGRKAVPQSILLDRYGSIVHHIIGPLTPQQLAELEAKVAALTTIP